MWGENAVKYVEYLYPHKKPNAMNQQIKQHKTV